MSKAGTYWPTLGLDRGARDPHRKPFDPDRRRLAATRQDQLAGQGLGPEPDGRVRSRVLERAASHRRSDHHVGTPNRAHRPVQRHPSPVPAGRRSDRRHTVCPAPSQRALTLGGASRGSARQRLDAPLPRERVRKSGRRPPSLHRVAQRDRGRPAGRNCGTRFTSSAPAEPEGRPRRHRAGQGSRPSGDDVVSEGWKRSSKPPGGSKRSGDCCVPTRRRASPWQGLLHLPDRDAFGASLLHQRPLLRGNGSAIHRERWRTRSVERPRLRPPGRRPWQGAGGTVHLRHLAAMGEPGPMVPRVHWRHHRHPAAIERPP